MVSNGALLLDVRTPGEFGNGHIQGAVNIPVDQLQARLAELGAKDKSIVVYCQSGGRSAAAKSLLDRAGFTTVYDLGPMSAWPQKR
ncbi:MAG: rhodanese-like domain-containing protein [Deltaproteobacteria bacterium]|nr:rhodanese-like domain-containing protein [Deltaproteobacteria bacterium]